MQKRQHFGVEARNRKTIIPPASQKNLLPGREVGGPRRLMMKRLYEYTCRVEIFLVKVFLVSFVALVFVAAATRYAGHPINWSVDIAVCLFAWCTFLGGDVAMRNNKLMNVEFFISKLPSKNKNDIEMLNLFIILIFLAALVGYGIKLSYTTRFRAFQGIPWFSYTWVTISVPIGSLLMAITTVRKLREKLTKRAKQSIENRDTNEAHERI